MRVYCEWCRQGAGGLRRPVIRWAKWFRFQALPYYAPVRPLSCSAMPVGSTSALYGNGVLYGVTIHAFAMTSAIM
jgi:hypothetical protein